MNNHLKKMKIIEPLKEDEKLLEVYYFSKKSLCVSELTIKLFD